MNAVVFVREVDHLDHDAFENVKDELDEESKNHTSTLLPRGFQSGQAVVAVFIAQSISPSLKEEISSKRSKGAFAKLFFPVVIDAKSGEATYFDKTPFVGGVYYPKLRWLAKRLASPGADLQKEPLSWLGVGMTTWIAAIVVLNLARWL